MNPFSFEDAPAAATAVVAPRPLSRHHANQSFVSTRITRLIEGASVRVKKQGKLHGKNGYVTCALGRSCMVKIKKDDGEWDAIEELVHEKDLIVLATEYHKKDCIEVMNGIHQGKFGTIQSKVTSVDDVEMVSVSFWSERNAAKVHSVATKMIHSTQRTRPRRAKQGQGETKVTTRSHLPAPAVSNQVVTVEVDPFQIGDWVQITNQALSANYIESAYVEKKSAQRNHYEGLKNLEGKTGQIVSLGLGFDGANALVSFHSETAAGFEYTRQMNMKYLKLAVPGSDRRFNTNTKTIPTVTGSVVLPGATAGATAVVPFYEGQKVQIKMYKFNKGWENVARLSDAMGKIRKVGTEIPNEGWKFGYSKIFWKKFGYLNQADFALVDVIGEDPVILPVQFLKPAGNSARKLKRASARPSAPPSESLGELSKLQFSVGSCVVLDPEKLLVLTSLTPNGKLTKDMADVVKYFPWDDYKAIGFVSCFHFTFSIEICEQLCREYLKCTDFFLFPMIFPNNIGGCQYLHC